MAAFSSAFHQLESSFFKLGGEFSNFPRHLLEMD